MLVLKTFVLSYGFEFHPQSVVLHNFCSRFSMPHTPLRQLKPELFEDEYETESDVGGFGSDGSKSEIKLIVTPSVD